jgi:hypothetical protein
MDHKHECANFPKCWREWGCDYVDDDEAQVCRLCLEAALATALDALEAWDTYHRHFCAELEHGRDHHADDCDCALCTTLARLAGTPYAPVERTRALLHAQGRSLRWPEGTP